MQNALTVNATCINASCIYDPMERYERLAWARTNLSSYKSASEAARAMGIAVPTYAGHENGSRGITPAAAERYSNFYKISPEWLLYGRGSPRSGVAAPDMVIDPTSGTGTFVTAAMDAQQKAAERPEPNVDLSKAEDAPPLHRFGGPRNVPVLGTAVGGGEEDGDFRFNGETIDYAPRPPGIAHKKDVYVLYVENDSMFPKFEPGERLYVDPHRKPRIGDYAVVELYGAEEDAAGKGYIKRLVKQTTTKVVVSQFNPAKELEFDRDQVKGLHRVIPTDELLGV